MASRVYRSRVRATLTQPETEAVLSMIGAAMAGDVLETLGGDGRLVAAAHRARRKMFAARDTAEKRDAAKGRPPRVDRSLR